MNSATIIYHSLNDKYLGIYTCNSASITDDNGVHVFPNTFLGRFHRINLLAVDRQQPAVAFTAVF